MMAPSWSKRINTAAERFTSRPVTAVLTALCIALTVSAFAAAFGSSARANARPTADSEGQNAPDTDRLLRTSWIAIQHQTFHVNTLAADVNSPGWVDVQMGPFGWPRYLALNTTLGAFDDFTAQRARSCSGSLLSGDLVVHYSINHDPDVLKLVALNRQQWPGWFDDGDGGLISVQARERSSDDLLADVFELYAGRRLVTVGPQAMIDGHNARAFVSPQRPNPSAARPSTNADELEDWLWIDVDSHYLLRFQPHEHGVALPAGYRFTHAPGLELKPPMLPKGLVIPTCVK